MSAPIDKAIRKTYYNRCNPDQPLSPDDDRYVDIESTRAGARGRDLVVTMAERIELSEGPVLELFTGLPGSGKSTELKRLAKRLEDKNGANLLAVHIGAEHVLDIGSPIDIPDILIGILHKTEEAVLGAEGKDPRGALKAGPFTRLWHWLSTTDVEVKELELGAGMDLGVEGLPEANIEAKAAIELKTNESLRDKVRRRVNENMTTFIAGVGAYLRALNERAKKKNREGIVVLFDSLEKLRGGSTNWTAVLDSAERVFKGGAPYLQLPVHVVYTFPPALAMRLSGSVRFLPMLKIFDRKDQRSAGFDAAWDIVRHRIPEEHLREIFGPTSYEDRIDALIKWSGGYPREIVRLLQESILATPFDKEGSKFRKVLADAADQYRRTVTTSALPWLARVYVDKRAVPVDGEHRAVVDEALTNNVVLRYQNDDPWEDLHPAIKEMEELQQEVTRLLRSREEKKE